MRFIFLVTICLLQFPLYSQVLDSLIGNYDERIQKTHLNGIYIPENPTDALKQLDTLIESESSKEKFRSLSEEEAATKLHFSFGRWMIVNWAFYEGSRLSFWFRQAGVSYPDDMAKILMVAYHRKLNGFDPNIDSLCSFYKEKRKEEWQEQLRENIIGKIDTTREKR